MNVVSLFNEQQSLVNHFFEHLDHQQGQALIDNIVNCQEHIYLTGMGKSGIISKNISQMMISIGVAGTFINPVDALHGDIGSIKKGDLILVFSKSGQSDELIQLCALVKARGVYTIAIVSNPNSIIAQKCDMLVVLPLQKELCPFDLAPTTSTILQLILGNTIVAYLMRHFKLTKAEYAANHPAGRIGKRLTLRVSDVMRKTNKLPVCGPDELLIDNISNMSTNQSGFLLIIEENYTLLGLFTDGDLRRALQNHSSAALHRSMKELMTSTPTVMEPGAFAYDAMVEMERVDPATKKKSIKEIPVVTEGTLVGMVILHDLLNAGL